MSIKVNMTKAVEIHKDLLRSARQPLLEQLDVDFVRALEQGQDTAPIAEQKQQLRDVTSDPAIAAASTVDELKQVWPDVLGPSPLQ